MQHEDRIMVVDRTVISGVREAEAVPHRRGHAPQQTCHASGAAALSAHLHPGAAEARVVTSNHRQKSYHRQKTEIRPLLVRRYPGRGRRRSGGGHHCEAGRPFDRSHCTPREAATISHSAALPPTTRGAAGADAAHLPARTPASGRGVQHQHRPHGCAAPRLIARARSIFATSRFLLYFMQ